MTLPRDLRGSLTYSMTKTLSSGMKGDLPQSPNSLQLDSEPEAITSGDDRLPHPFTSLYTYTFERE